MKELERFTPLLKRFVANGPAGCALLVNQNGKTIYEHYEGYSDIEAQKHIQPDSIYRIFSMSKLITCTAALMLYERGLYLLNDPLYVYLPEFRSSTVYRRYSNGMLYTSPAVSPIRVKDLFTMSSGLSYNGDDTETARDIEKVLQILRKKENGFDVQDFSKAVAEVPLAFDPGTHYLYGMSHDVLGAFIEVVSGIKFSDFLRKEIFEPLGMVDTSFQLPDEKKERLCNLYDRDDKGRMTLNTGKDEDFVPDATFESGGAGLLSTIQDYTKFARMLAIGGSLNGVRILSPNTVRLMTTNHLSSLQLEEFEQIFSAFCGYGYGLGVRVMIDPPAGGCNGNLGEFGWSGALGTWVLIDPSIQLTAVYMQQLQPHLQESQQPRMRAVIYGALSSGVE
jgi:CubicO group peptidase (beta-lactamase class C family)